MSTLTAGAPANVLLEALERAGWGSLAGADLRGVRHVLAALTRCLEPRSGAGKATAEQIADRAGYTSRWTRRCLHILEELELIEWDRGGILDGKPVPSWFRVSKAGLLALVKIARRSATERLSERHRATRARIAAYSLVRTKSKRRPQTRRSNHAEVRTTLLSIEEVPTPAAKGRPVDREGVSAHVAQIRAQLRAARGKPAAVGNLTSAATRAR